MTQVKNPAEQNKPLETNDGSNQSYKNENDRSQEVDLPIPEKKNEDITTNNGNSTENMDKSGRLNNEESNDESKGEKSGKENSKQNGLDVNRTNNEQRKDKRGDEQEKEERGSTKETTTKDAGWQQDKMNEADNQVNKPSTETSTNPSLK